MKFESGFQQEYHLMGHERLVHAVQSSSNHPHTFQNGYKTPKQQSMPLLRVQHSTSHVDTYGVLNLIFFMKFEGDVLVKMTLCGP